MLTPIHHLVNARSVYTPAAMAGYSGTPLAKKLGIKEASRVLLIAAPKGFENTLTELPDAVQITNSARAKGPYDVIVAFFASERELTSGLPKLHEKLADTGGLWCAWPKKSSGLHTDVGETQVRAAGLGLGLVDNKVCAIDETWSGLRFVVRVKDRR
jgi:hypothetical protein